MDGGTAPHYGLNQLNVKTGDWFGWGEGVGVGVGMGGGGGGGFAVEVTWRYITTSSNQIAVLSIFYAWWTS